MNQKVKWLTAILVIFLAINIGIMIIYLLTSVSGCSGGLSAKLLSQEIVEKEGKLVFESCNCSYCKLTNESDATLQNIKVELLVDNKFVEELEHFNNVFNDSGMNQQSDCNNCIQPNETLIFVVNGNYANFSLKAYSGETQTTARFEKIETKSSAEMINDQLLITFIGCIILLSLIFYFKNKN